jgi:prevent-host-death family protein
MNVKTKKAVWQLQDAKARLSELVKSSVRSPQIITVRGEEIAVVLSMGTYREMTKPRQSIVEFFQNSPLADVELELPECLPEYEHPVFENLFEDD